MSDQRLLERFVRLCETRSVTGEERAVADLLLAEFAELGVEAVEDDSQARTGLGSGNLIARVPGRGEGWVAFFAHIDTVPHQGAIEVELADGVFRSVGDTILGADNKAAVTVLMELAAAHAADPAALGIELVLTTGEEVGMIGARALDLSRLRSPFGFALDHPGPIGEIVTAAPTYFQVVAHFKGIASHAGLTPEDGRSAITAASKAIAAMELGRLDEETTANVGIVEGGSAFNVVPEHCRVDAEARSLDQDKASAAAQAIIDACTWGASEGGCDVDVELTEKFRAFKLRSSAPGLIAARAALESCGFEPREVSTGGGSDANALLAAGFECVLLGHGTADPHTAHESVPARRLHEAFAVCDAIAMGAGGRPETGAGRLPQSDAPEQPGLEA